MSSSKYESTEPDVFLDHNEIVEVAYVITSYKNKHFIFWLVLIVTYFYMRRYYIKIVFTSMPNVNNTMEYEHRPL